MGCNTSKESIQPAGEETKEDAKNGDIPKAEGAPAEGTKESNEEKSGNGDSDRDKEEEAATRIQAAFRGHHARKSMKETEACAKQTGTKEADVEPTKEQLQEEFRADDKELCSAATKIQASFRGHMSRKEQQAGSALNKAAELVDNAASKIEEKVEDAVNELEGIDLTDPELHKAATKIQASFRGHKVRQEVGVPGEDEPKN